VAPPAARSCRSADFEKGLAGLADLDGPLAWRHARCVHCQQRFPKTLGRGRRFRIGGRIVLQVPGGIAIVVGQLASGVRRLPGSLNHVKTSAQNLGFCG
jgi:hypothetical protein